MKVGTALTWAALLMASALSAQHDRHHISPYAEGEVSDIAALSPQEVGDLESGAGMGMARAAELNHYPGPLHVLELSAELELSSAQRVEVERIRAAMLEEAISLGSEILEAERHLDRRFASGHVDISSLRTATAGIARLRGELRFTHLRAHLETRGVLSEGQVETYDRLRGYVGVAEDK